MASACSVNLVQGDQGDRSFNALNRTQADSAPLFDKIPLILGNDTLWLSEGLRQEYNRAANQDFYPREKCNGSASIRAQVAQNAEATPWSIPLFVLPFWPVMPVDETWTYMLKVQIHCDGVLVKQAEYKEEETIKANLYGKLELSINEDGTVVMDVADEHLEGTWEKVDGGIHFENELFEGDFYYGDKCQMIIKEIEEDDEIQVVLTKVK